MARRKRTRDTNQPAEYLVDGIIPGASVKLTRKKRKKVGKKASKK